MAYVSQVLKSLTTSSLFGTGDAGTPGDHRSEDFPAPSQDRSKRSVSHHMIPPLCHSITADVTPFLFFRSKFLYGLCFNSKYSCTTCISLRFRLHFTLCTWIIKLLFIFGPCVACLAHTLPEIVYYTIVLCNCSNCNLNKWVTREKAAGFQSHQHS